VVREGNAIFRMKEAYFRKKGCAKLSVAEKMQIVKFNLK